MQVAVKIFQRLRDKENGLIDPISPQGKIIFGDVKNIRDDISSSRNEKGSAPDAVNGILKCPRVVHAIIWNSPVIQNIAGDVQHR